MEENEIVELEIEVPQKMLERLKRALAKDKEYTKENDLFAYILLLGFYLKALQRTREELEEEGKGVEEIYQVMYEELARVQSEYAREHFSFAEAARDEQTGRMVNSALRKEVSATRNYLLPRLQKEREQLLERKEALLQALGENA